MMTMRTRNPRLAPLQRIRLSMLLTKNALRIEVLETDPDLRWALAAHLYICGWEARY